MSVPAAPTTADTAGMSGTAAPAANTSGPAETGSQTPPLRQSTCCAVCSNAIPFDYHGPSPPFAPKLLFLEDVYAIRDPFTSAFTVARPPASTSAGPSPSLPAQATPKRCLVMGGTCCACNATICMKPSCSLFYARRFCATCAASNATRFPAELQQDIARLKPAAPLPR